MIASMFKELPQSHTNKTFKWGELKSFRSRKRILKERQMKEALLSPIPHHLTVGDSTDQRQEIL